MKILAVSDEVAPQVYTASARERFSDVDLVVSCGDLPGEYLEYIVSVLDVPLLYVIGNHANEVTITSSGEAMLPGGCINIDGQVAEFGGLVFAGLQGSMRYREGPYQYTQAEMRYRALALGVRLFHKRALRRRRLDVLVTHAPPLGIHDGQDVCHTGFDAFLKLMDRFEPRYLLHGHCHVYNRLKPTATQYNRTMVLNVHPFRIVEVEPVTSE